MTEWNRYVSTEREKALEQLIQEEKLREPETRKFLQNAFRDGEIKTTGTDIDKLMPPVSRFGGGGARAKRSRPSSKNCRSFSSSSSASAGMRWNRNKQMPERKLGKINISQLDNIVIVL